MEINRLRQIKMRHVLAFVETVRCGSLKAAADRIGLTQPAVSKTLKDLERILDVKLLERNRAGIALTRAGAAFRPFAEQGMVSLGHGVTRLEALSRGRDTPLRLGALPSVAADFLPEAVQRFSDIAPGTPISVEDGRIGALIERLRAGDLDLVVGRLGSPSMMTGLSFTQIYSERVIFAAATGHPAARETDLRALTRHRLLYPPQDAAIRPIVDRFMISHGLPASADRFETVSSVFGRAMTLGSARAIWIISHGVVARDIAAGRMVALPINTDAMSGPIGVMARSEETPTPAMQLFRQALLESPHPG